MPRAALVPIVLVVLAGLADAAALHALSFFLLVAAVPAAAVAALVTLDSSFARERARPRLLAYAWLNALALVFLLVATAARAPVRGDVPRVAVSAFVACLLVFVAEGVVAAAPAVRSRRVPRQTQTRLAER